MQLDNEKELTIQRIKLEKFEAEKNEYLGRTLK